MQRRVRDPAVLRQVVFESDECVSCGDTTRRRSAHHVLHRSQGGDDVRENLLVLCGDGVAGCHGRYHNGDAQVLSLISAAIEARPDIAQYILDRLGVGPGRDYLFRRYLVVVG